MKCKFKVHKRSAQNLKITNWMLQIHIYLSYAVLFHLLLTFFFALYATFCLSYAGKLVLLFCSPLGLIMLKIVSGSVFRTSVSKLRSWSRLKQANLQLIKGMLYNWTYFWFRISFNFRFCSWAIIYKYFEAWIAWFFCTWCWYM